MYTDYAIINKTKCIQTFWGISSVGRALRWQRKGQGFETPMLHRNKKANCYQLFKKTKEVYDNGKLKPCRTSSSTRS